MKFLKVLGVIVILLVLILGGGLYYSLSNINAIVKRGVESKGPEITTTDVNLDSVDIELFKGRAQLDRFTIANPPGFNSPNLFEAEQLVFKVDPSSVRSDVIIIDEIIVEGVKVTAEQKGLNTNIQTMLKAIQENLPKSRQEEKEASDAGQEPHFMVQHLRFADSGMRVITEKYGEKEFLIPAIEANNLGSKANGLTASELGVAILKPYLEQAKKVAQERIQDLAEDELKGAAEKKLKEKFGEDAEKALDKVKDLF